MLSKADIATVCIFRSTPENVAKFAADKISGDTMALSDKKGSVYAIYHVSNSMKAVARGSIHINKNFRKYKPYMNVVGALKDSDPSTVRQLPADFLIDENGIIADLFRAENLQEFMPFERIEQFIPDDKRCKCYKKDCISPSCRAEYEVIKQESAAMLYTGGDDDEE